jgi:broad specificity phosphatase PhoE
MSSPRRTHVYLARHCDVRNPQGVLYGHLPDFPLSEKGVAQAHAMGAHLAAGTARKIFASPLERAQQTAQIIAEHIAGAEIITTDDLIEARFGLYLQGVRPKDVPRKRPLWMVHMVWPGLLSNDETVSQMAARVQRPIDRILESSAGDGGICVSHGDPIQAFWVKADGRRDWALHRLQCAKGGMLELDYADQRLVRTRYRPPERTGAPASNAPAEAGGHS